MSFVPPPPPGVVVPQAPAATPAKIVKPGGVALDMSDLFGPPKTGGKKALPPWERKRKTPPPGNPTQSKDGPLGDGTATKATPTTTTTKTSPPVPASAPPSALPGAANRLVFRSTAETSYPSLSSLPTAPPAESTAASAGPNAPVAVTRKSVPTVALSASQAHSTAPPPPPPLPATSMLSSAVPAATTTAVAPPPSLPQVVSLPAVVPVPATAGAVAHSASAPAAGGPLVAPLPTYPASLAVASPLPASVVGGAPPAAAGASNTQAAPPLPGSDPAAVAASAHIVEAALRDMRMHLATPSHTVVAPHVVFQGREQKVSVMPLGPVPPRKETRKKGAAPTSTPPASSSDVWWNAYDLRPSPSWTPAQHQAQSAPRRATAAGPTKRDGRGAYFQNVDVHRYIARRYFGEPAPVEH